MSSATRHGVVHIITSLEEGGAETALYRLCTGGSPGLHRVICLMGGGKYGPLLRASGVPLDCLGLPQGRLGPAALLQLWRLLRRHRPALVQTWMYHSDLVGGVAARLAGVPRLVWGVRTSVLDPASVRVSTLAVIRVCALLSWLLPDRIVCCAEAARLVHSRLGYAPAKLQVIPNGYDLIQLRPDPAAGRELRCQLGLGPQEPLLGMVGRFDPQKDHRTLLAALGLLQRQGRRLPCVLVGRGLEPGNPQLQEWIEEFALQSQLRLLGSRADVPAVMSALSLHVLSSAYGEAFPNVLAEAMACGVPCIATAVGDSGLIIGGTGWLVPPRDPPALAAALADALDEPSADQAARRQAVRERIASCFTLSQMVQRFESLYRELA